MQRLVIRLLRRWHLQSQRHCEAERVCDHEINDQRRLQTGTLPYIEFHRHGFGQGVGGTKRWPITINYAPVAERPIMLLLAGEGAPDVAHDIHRNTSRSNLSQCGCTYDAK